MPKRCSSDTADSPWLVIQVRRQKRARLGCMRHVLSTLPYPGKDPKVIPADAQIVGSAANVLAADGSRRRALQPAKLVGRLHQRGGVLGLERRWPAVALTSSSAFGQAL